MSMAAEAAAAAAATVGLWHRFLFTSIWEMIVETHSCIHVLGSLLKSKPHVVTHLNHRVFKAELPSLIFLQNNCLIKN